MAYMQLTAKADYAIRALIEIGAAEGAVKGDEIAEAQDMPRRFLENTRKELRAVRIVGAERGPSGGYRLHKPAEEITLAEIIDVVDGPLLTVRSHLPEEMEYEGRAQPLSPVWLALRRNMRSVLEAVTLADLIEDRLPDELLALAEED